MFDVEAPNVELAAIEDQDSIVDAILSAEETQSDAPSAPDSGKKGEVVSLDSFRDKSFSTLGDSRYIGGMGSPC